MAAANGSCSALAPVYPNPLWYCSPKEDQARITHALYLTRFLIWGWGQSSFSWVPLGGCKSSPGAQALASRATEPFQPHHSCSATERTWFPLCSLTSLLLVPHLPRQGLCGPFLGAVLDCSETSWVKGLLLRTSLCPEGRPQLTEAQHCSVDLSLMAALGNRPIPFPG